MIAGAKKRLTMIAAAARNGTIGQGNTLPWKMPSDLKRFRTATMGKSLIMGRKTMESIGRPLPGRFSIVLSRRSDLNLPGFQIAQSVDQAIALAEIEGAAEEAMVIGGEEIYRLFFPHADRMILTMIDHECAGDAFFPFSEIQNQGFQVVNVEDHLANEKDEFASSTYFLERSNSKTAIDWTGRVKPILSN